MTENRYDDEVLSTILDGEASEELVAAVRTNSEAQQRLRALQSAVDHVGEPVPAASSERRAQSIAAAMAAATPAAPEVTSLAAQRHKRTEAKQSSIPGWLIAAAAAVIAFIVATPFLFNGGEVADTATESADAAEVVEESAADESDTAEDVATDAAVASDDTETEEEAMEEEAMEEEAMDDESAADEEVVEEAADADSDEAEDVVDSEDGEEEPAPTANLSESVNLDLQVVPSVEELALSIDNATITAQLAGDDILAIETLQARSTSALDEVLATDVNPQCLEAPEGVTNPTPYSIVVLDPFAGPATLVVVEFADDGTTRLLDAETCAVIG